MDIEKIKQELIELLKIQKSVFCDNIGIISVNLLDDGIEILLYDKKNNFIVKNKKNTKYFHEIFRLFFKYRFIFTSGCSFILFDNAQEENENTLLLGDLEKNNIKQDKKKKSRKKNVNHE